MTLSEKTSIVCDMLGVERLWGARLAHQLQLQSEAHGGGADSDFRGIVEVVGISWKNLLVSKDVEVIATKDSAYIFEESNGFYYMNALVGGIAMSTLYFSVTSKEVDYWKEYGDYYLEKIFLEVARNSEVAKARNLF